MSAGKVHLEIQQGEDFSFPFRWATSTPTFKAITGITKAAPPVITATGHGLVNGWPVALTNVGGMTQINGSNPPEVTDYRAATVLSSGTLSLPIDASGYSTYTSGGVLQYPTPRSLSGYTARMQIRARVTSSTTLLELTTANSRITIDDTTKLITLSLTAAVTAGLTWRQGVYDLEMVSGGVVETIMYGNVKVLKEVTR